MKKFFLFILIFSLNFSVMAQDGVYSEETEQRGVKQTQRFLLCGHDERPIRIAGYMNYPPFGWKEKDWVKEQKTYVATYYGVGVELFKRFAKEYNLRYQYVNMLNFNEAKYALSVGYFDILLNDYFTANSYSNIDYFYPGYIANPVVIVTLKDDKENAKAPESFEELKGKKGLVRAEENIYDLIYRQVPSDVELKQVNGVKRAFQALLRKEVDFLVMSQLAYETESRRYKIGNYVTYGKKPIIAPVIFMSYARGNRCAAFIKKELEKKLKEYAADENLIRSLLSAQIANWENKFINEKSLIYETEFAPEEEVEQTNNLDEWLKQQQEASEQKKEEEKKRSKALI